MQTLKSQLLEDKLVYVSKKEINDTLSDYVLKHIKSTFIEDVFTATVTTLQNYYPAVKGGIALNTFLKETHVDTAITDIDLELGLTTNDFNAVCHDHTKLYHYLPIQKLLERLDRVIMQYIDNIKSVVNHMTIQNVWPYSEPFVMFKTYRDEAIAIEQHHAKESTFVVNTHQNYDKIVKLTVSLVNNQFLLVRFSINVKMLNDYMTLYLPNDTAKQLSYFPFDVFFLDVSIKPFYDIDALNTSWVYGKKLNVHSLRSIVNDQLDSLFYVIAHRRHIKKQQKINKLQSILHEHDLIHYTLCESKQYNYILYQQNSVYKPTEMKRIYKLLGPYLGAVLIKALYERNRFINNIQDLTFHVNFPFHKQLEESKYFSMVWEEYIECLYVLFGESINNYKAKNYLLD